MLHLVAKWVRSGRVTRGIRRSVHLCSGAQDKGVKLWAFGYESLAQLYGVPPGTVRQWVNRKRLDPHSLESICEMWEDRS